MSMFGVVPRRCVNLPPGSLLTLLGRTLTGRLVRGGARDAFEQGFASYLGADHVVGAATGRSAFQLALEALDLPKGSEIVFPVFTFPVMPMVAEILGYVPVFCDVDPLTFNAGPEHVAPVLSEKTGAVLATHLFGRPCPIEELAALTKRRGIRLLEDCAHACGVRVGSRRVGTFGDVGIFSFAQGKNMPCFGGGAVATSDANVAARAREIATGATPPSATSVFREGLSVWLKWLLTRPIVFSLTAYPALRLKQRLGKPLMDSDVGDDLLDAFRRSNPQVHPLANLQGAIGLKQLKRIDRFNEGARANAQILSEGLAGVRSVTPPPSSGDHIYVYYPLGVDATLRDDLRGFLLRRGVDTKYSDMADCSVLAAFRTPDEARPDRLPAEASLLEICVYPAISARSMRRAVEAIRAWSAEKDDAVA